MPGDILAFGPFELDPDERRLLKNGEPVALPPRQFDLLLLLAAQAGRVLSKDALVEAAWAGIAVTDNSVEQAISGLRRALATSDGSSPIETQARRGYRFTGTVRRIERREPEASLDALLAPHRAWVEGRAALETLERAHVLHARDVFERVLTMVPDQASAHVGLANACVMQFEMTRSEREPDTAALASAVTHARDACRLDPRYGEGWATLGFVLDRTGHRDDALAASRIAVTLEPDNWRHHLRLAYVSWGEERLREARRTLTLLPGFPLAHWLAATVHVARQAFDEAERELRTGLAAESALAEPSRFGSVALHWLLGLLLLRRGDETEAQTHFSRELASEAGGHLYARECCANTWYAIAALRLRAGDVDAARTALDETLTRVPRHPAGRAMLSAIEKQPFVPSASSQGSVVAAELALGDAVGLSLRGDVAAAVDAVDAALATVAVGSAMWTLPVDPVIRPTDDERWMPVLARLRNRAA
ncbi:MAG: winged helix-turn-helix domain-containing protein [Vicinamibacterales bacterium]